jgi:hypothetical protein
LGLGAGRRSNSRGGIVCSDYEDGDMEDDRTLYTEEQRKQFEELHQELGDETIRAIEHDWAALLADVRRARQLAPESLEGVEGTPSAEDFGFIQAPLAAHVA